MNPMNTLNPQATLPVNSQVDNTFNFNVDIRADASINLDIDTSFGEFISQNDMSQLLATTDPQTPLGENSFKMEPQSDNNQMQGQHQLTGQQHLARQQSQQQMGQGSQMGQSSQMVQVKNQHAKSEQEGLIRQSMSPLPQQQQMQQPPPQQQIMGQQFG